MCSASWWESLMILLAHSDRDYEMANDEMQNQNEKQDLETYMPQHPREYRSRATSS